MQAKQTRYQQGVYPLYAELSSSVGVLQQVYKADLDEVVSCLVSIVPVCRIEANLAEQVRFAT